MQRNTFLKIGGLGLAATFLPNLHLFAAGINDPWTIKMLSEDTGVFTERGGTILFHISKEGLVVVDTEFPEQARHLITELDKRSDKGYRLLINTHHHGDHSSGNIEFKGKVPVLLAHANSLRNQRSVAESQNNLDKQYLPDKTFTDTAVEKIGNETIRLHYFGPAHTDGDAIIHFERNNIVHMGDLINNRRYPYIDRTAGASITNWIKVLDKTVATFHQSTTYVFGHASEGFNVYGKREDILKMKDYFEKLVAFAQKEISAGRTREEFLANQSIPGVTEWVGTGIERSLTAAWEEFYK